MPRPWLKAHTCSVIPTVILIGLVVGRWWVLPFAATGWAALLLIQGTLGVGEIPAAGALGLANAAVGVLVHKGIAASVRRSRDTHFPSTR